MKPIEAGCKAVVMRGHASGREVKVLRFVGSDPNRPDRKKLWEVEPLSDLANRGIIARAQECNLMRIDGYEELETEKKEMTA